jgi:predicted nucleic acid-binding protein
MRVAVDANVLIAGTVFPRWPYEVLRHAERGDFTLVLSPIVLREARRRINQQFPAFDEAFERFLALIAYEEAPVPTVEEVKANPDLVRQKKDIPVALSVGAAGVDHFVTYDKDFTDQGETTAKVRQLIVSILLPPVFLREVMGWTSEELEAIRYREWSDLESAQGES